MNSMELAVRAGQIFRRLRLQKDVTQEGIAANLPHMDTPRYHRLEKGKSPVHLQDIFDIAAYYDLHPSDLIAMIQCSEGQWEEHGKLLAQIDELKRERAQLIAKLSAHGIMV